MFKNILKPLLITFFISLLFSAGFHNHYSTTDNGNENEIITTLDHEHNDQICLFCLFSSNLNDQTNFTEATFLKPNIYAKIFYETELLNSKVIFSTDQPRESSLAYL